MATIFGSCRELLLELVVYLWCTSTRLVFALWFYWKKPVPLPPVTDKLLLRSATSLAADIRNGKVRSVDLLAAYIRRIREVQPIVNAVVEERFEEALKDAEEVDRLVASQTMSVIQMSKEKPLLGLPFTSKNSIAIKGGEGSLLAAAGSLLGLGTDAAGSVRIPSAYCGVFGHKPTAGVVPNTGLMPELGENVAQFNCVGPMTRFAEDLLLMLNVLAGSDTNKLRLNEQVNLKALKLYYMDTEGSLYLSRVITNMRLAVRRVTKYLTTAHRLQAHQLCLPEMRFGMYEWFKVIAIKDPTPLAQIFRPGGFHTLVELLRHLVGAGRHTLAALVSSQMAPLHHFRLEQKAEEFVTSIENANERFEETLGDDGVLILPAATSAAPYQNQEFLFPDSTGMTALFNLFKVPATVCPVMRSADNLPLCVQVVAKRGNDRLCLAVAKEIEKRFGGCIDPSAKHERKM
ncbi:fatty-acid amide hydrolase 2-A isoform X2 [Rhipicephalus microplus]|uniref:fatty-acid amide hydrolase 2-A isoform X2 n=1 Tax=Rhipicephalus microplus TaxID=6941 RepID=UPI003F6D1F71